MKILKNPQTITFQQASHPSNKRLVNLMYGYSEYRMDSPTFYEKFDALTKNKIQKKPSWLEKLINWFKNTDINNTGNWEQISETEFRHDITKTLYTLKKAKKFDKIIKSDYSDYV